MNKRFSTDDYLVLYRFQLLLKKTFKVILLNFYTLFLLMVLSIGISYYFSTQQTKKFETQISFKTPSGVFFPSHKVDVLNGNILGSSTLIADFFFKNFLSNANSRDNVKEFLSIYNSSNSPVVSSFKLREVKENTYALIFYDGVDGVNLLNEYVIWTKNKTLSTLDFIISKNFDDTLNHYERQLEIANKITLDQPFIKTLLERPGNLVVSEPAEEFYRGKDVLELQIKHLRQIISLHMNENWGNISVVKDSASNKTRLHSPTSHYLVVGVAIGFIISFIVIFTVMFFKNPNISRGN